MTTWDKVRDRLQGLKHKGNAGGGHSRYLCLSPLREERDPSFSLIVHDDGEHGAWLDFGTGESGSLYQLAARLNVEVTFDHAARRSVESSKRRYAGLADYAEAHGASEEVFAAAKWREGEHAGRPALFYPVQTGTRIRYLDDSGARYGWTQAGAANCWYGLDRALRLVDEWRIPYPILCNGEASTVVAQSFGLPAFSAVGGEKSASAPAMLTALLDKLAAVAVDGLIVAFDCDAAGVNAANAVAAALKDKLKVMVVDLGMARGGDLADHCRLHQGGSYDAFLRLLNDLEERRAALARAAEQARQEERATLADGADYVLTLLHTVVEQPILNPFRTLHGFGGFAHVFRPGLLYGAVGASGGMKTAFLEVLGEKLMHAGTNIVWWGAEWDEKGMALRALTRMTGIPAAALHLHQLALAGHQDGRRLSDEQVDQARIAMTTIRLRQQGMIIVKPPRATIDAVLGAMGDAIDDLRRAGKDARVCMLDYLQLISRDPRQAGADAMDHVLTEYKRFAQTYQVIAWATSQTPKAQQRAVRQQNADFDGESMQYARADKFNLLVGLTVPRNPDAQSDPADAGRITIIKNSDGAVGEVWVKVSMPHRLWIDQRAARPLWAAR